MDDRDELRRTDGTNEDVDSTIDDGDSHATTGGAAGAGAVTGGVIGLAGGPIGAAVGAVGGAIVGAAAERVMHHDDDEERANMGLDNDGDANPLIESRDRTPGMDTTATTGDQGRMQLREEELETRKTSTETGEVRLGKEVVSEQRTVEVPVTREEVYIERQPIDRRPSDTPISETERASIDMPVREEHVTIEKQPVVYEEVGVGKRQVEETRDVNATVRREELRVDQEGDARLRGSATAGGYQEYVSGWRSRPEYRGRSWTDVEGDIERDWSVTHPDTPWTRARESIRSAWENATD